MKLKILRKRFAVILALCCAISIISICQSDIQANDLEIDSDEIQISSDLILTESEKNNISITAENCEYIQDFCIKYNVANPINLSKINSQPAQYSIGYYTDSLSTMHSLVCILDENFIITNAIESNAIEDVITVTDLITNEVGTAVFQPYSVGPNPTCSTWTCNSYESGGGYTIPTCERILSLAVGVADKIFKLEWFGWLVTQLGVIVGCYVPSYKYCISGSWKPVCPM